LSGTCGGEDFAERVQAESEQRPSAATMFLTGMGCRRAMATPVLTESVTAKAMSASKCTVVRVSQVRGLQREAFSLEIGEHGFDRPPLTICGERVTRIAGTGQGQQLT